MQPTIRKTTSYQRRTGRLSRNKKALLQHSAHLITCMTDSDFVQMLAQAARIKLEIGFGMGEHLCNNIRNDSDTLHLGAEIYRPGIASLLNQLRDLNAQNAYLIEADATDVIEQLPAHSLDHIDIHHPDPWPKKRHQKRQLINANFLCALLGKLKTHGQCHIITDDHDYFMHIVSACKCLSRPNVHIALEYDRKPNSKYGRKAMAEGRQINAILLTIQPAQ